MFDLFIVAFNSTMVELGNSILKTLNGIKLSLLYVSMLYIILVVFFHLC